MSDYSMLSRFITSVALHESEVAGVAILAKSAPCTSAYAQNPPGMPPISRDGPPAVCTFPSQHQHYRSHSLGLLVSVLVSRLLLFLYCVLVPL